MYCRLYDLPAGRAKKWAAAAAQFVAASRPSFITVVSKPESVNKVASAARKKRALEVVAQIELCSSSVPLSCLPMGAGTDGHFFWIAQASRFNRLTAIS
jgi:hypothetical protein